MEFSNLYLILEWGLRESSHRWQNSSLRRLIPLNKKLISKYNSEWFLISLWNRDGFFFNYYLRIIYDSLTETPNEWAKLVMTIVLLQLKTCRKCCLISDAWGLRSEVHTCNRRPSTLPGWKLWNMHSTSPARQHRETRWQNGSSMERQFLPDVSPANNWR